MKRYLLNKIAEREMELLLTMLIEIWNRYFSEQQMHNRQFEQELWIIVQKWELKKILYQLSMFLKQEKSWESI